MKKYEQVIVVEGKHDEQKIKSIFPDVECIVTNGSEVSSETLNLIYQTSLKREVILFLDPDYPGKKITLKILNTKGDYKIAFINKENAISTNRKKVGVEHASKEDIIACLENLFTVKKTNGKITTIDLMRRDLIHSPNAQERRNIVSKSLNIPLLNGKSMLKTCNMLGIDLERIDAIFEREQRECIEKIDHQSR